MKIELIKETTPDCPAFYSIEVDGHYLDGSTSLNIETTKALYIKFIEENATKREVILSTEL